MTSSQVRAGQTEERTVGVAQCAVLRGSGALVTHGLGSCVAIVLYDPTARVAGLAHILLPNESYSRDRSRPTKFADTAVPYLIDEMRRAGAGRRLTARLIGGASMFGALLSTNGVNMGDRNVASARVALGRAGVVITGEDVGGDFGRSISVSVADGAITVTSLLRGPREL